MEVPRNVQPFAAPFKWPWPAPIDPSESSPLRGTALQFPNGRRLFFMARRNRAEFDRIALYGLMLLLQDGKITAEDFRRFVGMVLLYMGKHHLQEYRPHPLTGLRGSYRESRTTTFAAGVLGKPWEAWEKLFPPGSRTPRYSPQAFRRQLGTILSVNCRPRRPGVLPPGVMAVFSLPPWSAELEAGVDRVLSTMADRGARWVGPQRRGHRPKDVIPWLKAAFSKPQKPPFRVERDELVWAVAYGTCFAQAACHAYAMCVLMDGITPPLDRAERLLFYWFHFSTSLVGIPWDCLPDGYRQLVGRLCGDALMQRVPLSQAKDRAAQILNRHTILADDARDQDRQRKRRQAAARRQNAAARTLRRNANRVQKPLPLG